jgi:anti-sigma factor RsiW
MTRDDELRLHAYLDGELGATESIEFERRLTTEAELRAGLAELREISARIRSQAHYHEAPPQLSGRVMARVRRRSMPARARVAWFASLAAATAMAASVAWFAPAWIRQQVEGWDARSAQALDAHLRAVFSSHWVDVASSDRHTVKPWLSARLGFSPAVPDLSEQGYELIGGRVDVLDAAPVATLVYQRRQHMISVFVSPGASSGTSDASERRGYHMLGWTHSGFRYCAVSDLNEVELRDFARLISSPP